jgi:hypothetical protein
VSRRGDLAIGLLVARADAGVEDYFGCHGVVLPLALSTGWRREACDHFENRDPVQCIVRGVE